jgi:hypothetical protein
MHLIIYIEKTFKFIHRSLLNNLGQKSSEIIYIEYNVQKQIIGETNCPIVMSNI